MIITMYGIPNCDTVKKARNWLTDNGVAFQFHDFKKAGVPRAALEEWVTQHGWEVVLNRAGTTFKKLPGHQYRRPAYGEPLTLPAANARPAKGGVEFSPLPAVRRMERR